MLQLPPIPRSILGLSDIEVERVEISYNSEFIITIKNTQKEVKCKKCNNPTEPHGHGRVIRLRHLPIFDHTTRYRVSKLYRKCLILA
ncbi:ISL3 family transposase domain protein [Candidatus Trichorickettsia mobilis]|uniref:ISL3 family transposase domain protein n=1 Tax=Candidatus Trichorickettsia mobilis TaxID=1346319 RepID=A0ABZ0USP4_9RICK|nr:ISL3 family transposase domain protein [Candidatus Trichorickettsia mobilis]